MIAIDTTQMTPLEKSAVEYAASLEVREEGTPAPTAQAYMEAFVSRAVESWKSAYIDASLPSLRPLAEKYLDLTAAEKTEIEAHLDQLSV